MINKAKIMTIFDIDFTTLYKNHFNLSSRKDKTPKDWKDKAKKMQNSCFDLEDDYTKQFIQAMKFDKTDTILDVGCGGGALALALAPYVKAVYALDFCQDMLDIVTKRAKDLKIKNIFPILRAWEEDWQDIPVCDICISSRSSMVSDLNKALDKLNKHAKKAVYMSMIVEKDFISPKILQAIKRDSVGFPNYIYALNLLYQKNYFASVNFIESKGSFVNSQVISTEDFIESVSWSIGKLSEQEIEYLKDFHMQNPQITSAYEPLKKWALLHWDKNK
ncbi:class I SAM-dependent methyltransferase [Campylobacter sp.]|uniref:class I SAM-dependent methyltransferase n=1 Tax=Campylobacter sp. TaxID=205 RepID=UPI0025C56CB7|nr:class I SAM-dependent methyltransferase [Campylobacter sp.]